MILHTFLVFWVIVVGANVTAHADTDNCRHGHIYNEDLNKCLEKCGRNVTCKMDEYCDKEKGACADVCFGGCGFCYYCDVNTAKCEPCKDVCLPEYKDEFPDCRMNCPEEFRKIEANESACWDIEETTTTTSLATDIQSDMTVKIVAPTSVFSLFAIIFVFILILWKRKRIKTKAGQTNLNHVEQQHFASAQNGPTSPTSQHEAEVNHSPSKKDIESNKNDSVCEQQSRNHHQSAAAAAAAAVAAAAAAAAASVTSQQPSSSPTLAGDKLQKPDDGYIISSENCPLLADVTKNSQDIAEENKCLLSYVSNDHSKHDHISDSQPHNSQVSDEQGDTSSKASLTAKIAFRTSEPSSLSFTNLDIVETSECPPVYTDTDMKPDKVVTETVADHQQHSLIVSISSASNHDHESSYSAKTNVSWQDEPKSADTQNHSSVSMGLDLSLSLHSVKSDQKSIPDVGLVAEEPPQEEKLTFPQQETNAQDFNLSALLRQIAEQQDLDLREDGNLPDNDAVSRFDEEHLSNQGAAAARPAAAPPPQAAAARNAPGPPPAIPGARVIQMPANVGFDLNAMLNQNQNPPVVHRIANVDDILRIPLNRRHQAEVDERARIAQIISGFHFVVYHIFTPNGVNVCVRPTDITLGEAKRVLVNAGVPEEMLELELFRYQDESDDSGVHI